VPAIQDLLPTVEHRFCMRHLYANFRKRFSGKKLKILMWKAARSTHPVAWERVMLTIKELNIMLTDTLLLYLQCISISIIFLYKYLIHMHINTDAIIDASSRPNLDLVVEPYATQLSTI